MITAGTQARQRVLWPHLVACSGYTLLAVLLTWPIAAHFNNAIVGEVAGVDAYQNAWNLWWVARAISQLRSPFWTDLLFYPVGVDLFWQTLGFSQGVVALPVTWLLGPRAAVNFTVLTSFIIGGYSTFLLARRLTGNIAAALVAGCIFVCSPFHLEKVIDGNLEVAAIQWVPCFVYALYLLLEHPRWYWALLSGALLLWVSLGTWYYGMFCVVYTGCATLVWMLFRQRQQALRLALWGALPLVIWGLAIAPELVELTRTGDQTLQDMRSLQTQHSADLIDFFLPSPVNFWWGPAVRAARNQIYPDAVIWNVALGWVGLLLGGLGAVVAWRSNWRWALLLLITMFLALGPTLRIAGYNTHIPLPFALLQNLPGIRASQRPNHMVVISSLLLALLAAYGLCWLLQRLPKRIDLFATATIVAAVVLIDGYAGPLRLVDRPIHPFYAHLPAPDGALLPLPLYINVNRSENLTTQMTHTWPIVGGYVARPPKYPFATYTPGIRELQDGFATANDILSPGWPSLAQQALTDYNIRYVVMDLSSHKDNYFAGVRSLAQDLNLGAPLVADAALEAYAVPTNWEKRPILFLGAGWDNLEQQPDTTYRWRWMGATADLRLYNPFNRPVMSSIALTASSYQEARDIQIMLDQAAFGQIATQPDRPMTRRFLFLLPPGEHILTLTAPASDDPGRKNRKVSVRFYEITAQFAEMTPP